MRTYIEINDRWYKQLIGEQADWYKYRYRTHPDTLLHEAYKHPSKSKITAYNEMLREFGRTPTARDFSVICHNCQTFTVAWRIHQPYDALIVVTRAARYIILLEKGDTL